MTADMTTGRRRGSRVRSAVDPRQQREKHRSDAGHDHRADDFPLAGEVLQQLEEAEEVPLGPRDVAWRRSDRPAPRAAARRSRPTRPARRAPRRRRRCRAPPATDRKATAAPSRGRTGPEMPWRRISTRCSDDERDEHRRQEDDVHGVPARQRQRADRGASLQDAGDDITRERRQLRDVDRDDRRPVGALIPRQEITGQRKRRAPGRSSARPDSQVSLARRLVRAEARPRAACAAPDSDDDEAGAVVMEAAHDAARRRAE